MMDKKIEYMRAKLQIEMAFQELDSTYQKFLYDTESLIKRIKASIETFLEMEEPSITDTYG